MAARQMEKVMDNKAMVLARVNEVFGQDLGQAWLNRPNLAFNWETPAEMIRSSEGAQQVLEVLNAIAWGGAL